VIILVPVYWKKYRDIIAITVFFAYSLFNRKTLKFLILKSKNNMAMTIFHASKTVTTRSESMIPVYQKC
jgi:hypothetical protein